MIAAASKFVGKPVLVFALWSVGFEPFNAAFPAAPVSRR
jgi:hypothetical protein